jgi:hypothetical protein
MLLCDAMYDFVLLSLRRSVRDSHWSRDYRDGTGIQVFYENPGFYTTCQNEKIVYILGVQTQQRKEERRHLRMNWWYQESKHRCNGQSNWYSAWRLELTWRAPDEPTVWILVASDDWQRWIRGDRSIRWTDGPLVGTVGLSDESIFQDRDITSQRLVALDELMVPAAVHPMVMKMLTVRFWRETLQHRMNRRLSEEIVGVCVKGFVLAGFNGTWRGTRWTDDGEKWPSVHLTVRVSTAFSQWFFGCLGLFIPPPLTHLSRDENGSNTDGYCGYRYR